MSNAFPRTPNAFPRTIDGRTVAREELAIHGRLGAEALPRLAASGAATDGFEFAIRGGRNAQGKDCLRIEARGAVEMSCQRCLAPTRMGIDVDTELELADSDEEIAAADDDVDRALATPAMPVAALVEDEILLALPMVPRHAECEAPGSRDDAVASPFAALGTLRRVH
jgi:uncharacterized protein